MIVPPAPGVFSALGLLCAEVEIHKSRSFRATVSPQTVAEAQTMLADMAELAKAEAAQPGGRVSVTARMRYAGQSSDLQVVLGAPDTLNADAVRAAFVAEHDRVFKFTAPEGEPVRFTAIEVAYAIPVGQLDLSRRRLPTEGHATTQRAWFGDHGWLAAPVIPRTALRQAEGPCIVTDPDATTLVPPSASAVLTPLGGIEITLPQPAVKGALRHVEPA